MRNDVIQGCFAIGGPRIPAPPVQRMTPHGAPPPQRVNALPLPAHLAQFPRNGGAPIEPAVRQRMESVFGASFADVRIHVAPQATTIGARAFTQAPNIYFAPGQYAPQTAQGQQLLAYELAHVVQQRRGAVRNPFGGGIAVVNDAVLEAEAERMSRRTPPPPPPRATVQRAATPRHRAIQRKPAKMKVGNTTYWYDDNDPDFTFHPSYVHLMESLRLKPVPIFDITGKSQETLNEIFAYDATRVAITGLTVTSSNDNVAIAGSLSDGRNVRGSVALPQYYIDTTRAAGVLPVESAKAGLLQKARWTKAVRVCNIAADPKGMKIGDYLAYYVAVQAQTMGIQWVIAMHVVPKARNFYQRLGFQDYNRNRTYQIVLNELANIRGPMRTAGERRDRVAFERLSDRQVALTEEANDATMLVSVATLKQNARRNWESYWLKIAHGTYVNK